MCAPSLLESTTVFFHMNNSVCFVCHVSVHMCVSVCASMYLCVCVYVCHVCLYVCLCVRVCLCVSCVYL